MSNVIDLMGALRQESLMEKFDHYVNLVRSANAARDTTIMLVCEIEHFLKEFPNVTDEKARAVLIDMVDDYQLTDLQKKIGELLELCREKRVEG